MGCILAALRRRTTLHWGSPFTGASAHRGSCTQGLHWGSFARARAAAQGLVVSYSAVLRRAVPSRAALPCKLSVSRFWIQARPSASL